MYCWYMWNRFLVNSVVLLLLVFVWIFNMMLCVLVLFLGSKRIWSLCFVLGIVCCSLVSFFWVMFCILLFRLVLESILFKLFVLFCCVCNFEIILIIGVILVYFLESFEKFLVIVFWESWVLINLYWFRSLLSFLEDNMEVNFLYY